MAEVLGALSFLDTPDVNGDLVLLATNPVATGTGSLTFPTGTTAQRPASPSAGMSRYNTTTGLMEYYNGTNWVPTGGILQTIIGAIAVTSSNSQIPYDNTLPQSNEGVELWSQSFTPIAANSLILIFSCGFYVANTASDCWATLATFENTTCFSASLVGFSTSSGEGRGFSIVSAQTAGSTSARTYSARMGPNINTTLYYNRNAAGNLYSGGTVAPGQFIIQEIAQ